MECNRKLDYPNVRGITVNRLAGVVDRFYEAATPPDLRRPVLNDTRNALSADGVMTLGHPVSHAGAIWSEGLDATIAVRLREGLNERHPWLTLAQDTARTPIIGLSARAVGRNGRARVQPARLPDHSRSPAWERAHSGSSEADRVKSRLSDVKCFNPSERKFPYPYPYWPPQGQSPQRGSATVTAHPSLGNTRSERRCSHECRAFDSRSQENVMYPRIRIFASTFAATFDDGVKKEIARLPLSYYRGRSGVSVPRAFLAPAAIALFEAVRAAIRAAPSASRSSPDAGNIKSWIGTSSIPVENER